MQLRNLFKKYTGTLRNLKPFYVANNLLNYGKLKKNAKLYKAHGLHKSVVAPISSRDFKNFSANEQPWLDRDTAPAFDQQTNWNTFSTAEQDQIRQWADKGFMVLEQFIDAETVDQVNAEVDRLQQKGTVDFNFTGRKLFDTFRYSETIKREICENPKLLQLLSFLLGRQAMLFQSLNFIQGSEQKPHSDFIHMTTEPKGFLIAAWVALEDIQADAGPVVYYPGSHKLPYVLSNDYESGNTKWTIGDNNYKQYEAKIESLIQEHQLEPEPFLAKKGDVLIWHANLLHGGSPMLNQASSRKSMVMHYFAEGVICYHELTERPAILP